MNNVEQTLIALKLSCGWLLVVIYLLSNFWGHNLNSLLDNKMYGMGQCFTNLYFILFYIATDAAMVSGHNLLDVVIIYYDWM